MKEITFEIPEMFYYELEAIFQVRRNREELDRVLLGCLNDWIFEQEEK